MNCYPETLRITLECEVLEAMIIPGHPRKAVAGAHTLRCVWMAALPRSHSVPPPPPKTFPTPLLLLKKQFPSIFVSCPLTDALN